MRQGGCSVAMTINKSDVRRVILEYADKRNETYHITGGRCEVIDQRIYAELDFGDSECEWPPPLESCVENTVWTGPYTDMLLCTYQKAGIPEHLVRVMPCD
jgi:hypothetical protein